MARESNFSTTSCELMPIVTSVHGIVTYDSMLLCPQCPNLAVDLKVSVALNFFVCLRAHLVHPPIPNPCSSTHAKTLSCGLVHQSFSPPPPPPPPPTRVLGEGLGTRLGTQNMLVFLCTDTMPSYVPQLHVTHAFLSLHH